MTDSASLPAAPVTHPGRSAIVALLPIGALLGPRGLGLLSAPVLQYFDPAIPAALATLGVMAGLNLDRRLLRGGRRLEGLIRLIVDAMPIAVAAAAMYLVCRSVPVIGVRLSWELALAAGACVASSAFGANTLAITVGGLALAVLTHGGAPATASLIAQTTAAHVLMAIAGWLLITRATSEHEDRVFLFGSLLLVGGAAEYLSQSAVLAGLVAGLCWRAAGGPAVSRIERDLNYIEHPLLALILLFAGARAGSISGQMAIGVLFLSLVYLVLRIVGRSVGAWLVRRIAATDETDGGPTVDWLAPGALGIAIALSVQRGGESALPLLAIVVVGTLGSELLARVVGRREARE